MAEPQTIDDTRIVNNALARIGSAPIQSLDDETPKARQVKAIYYDRIDNLLTKIAWSFAALLYKLDAIPQDAAHDFDATQNRYSNGWCYAFALPGTRLSEPTRVLADARNVDDPLRNYRVENGILYADRTPIWAYVPVRAAPSSWSPAFRHAATVLVAADLAVPVAQDAKQKAELLEEGQGTPQENGLGGLIGAAMVQDASRARTNPPLSRSPLTDARLM